MTYEGQRAMFEAYRRNKYTSTGVIQWMFNNAWPSIYWHLFDWYLLPAGGYFGTKKANEPVHALFSYDDRSIAVELGAQVVEAEFPIVVGRCRRSPGVPGRRVDELDPDRHARERTPVGPDDAAGHDGIPGHPEGDSLGRPRSVEPDRGTDLAGVPSRGAHGIRAAQWQR